VVPPTGLGAPLSLKIRYSTHGKGAMPGEKEKKMARTKARLLRNGVEIHGAAAMGIPIGDPSFAKYVFSREGQSLAYRSVRQLSYGAHPFHHFAHKSNNDTPHSHPDTP
jgi:hypothetical protein